MRRLFVFLGLLCALSAAPVVTKAPSPATYFMRPAAACIPAERPVRLGGWAVRYSGVSMSGDDRAR